MAIISNSCFRPRFYTSAPSLRDPMPDVNHAKKLKGNSNSFSVKSCYDRVVRYPKIVKNCLRVASHIHSKGQFPLVHGQNCGFVIPQRVLKALGFTGMHVLRAHDSSVDQEAALKQLHERVEIAQKRYLKSPMFAHLMSHMRFSVARSVHPLRLDHDETNRGLLLAATIGTLHGGADSDAEFLEESPLYYVFGGARFGKYGLLATSNGNFKSIGTIELGQKMIVSGMQAKGYSEKKIASLLKCLSKLYSQAFALPIGQLMVIGAPKESPYVYHSRPYGIPTGIPLQQLIFKPRDEHQVRVVLSQEALESQNLSLTNVMDIEAVNAFCGSSQESADVEECMETLFEGQSRQETDYENSFLQGYQKLVNAVDLILVIHGIKN